MGEQFIPKRVVWMTPHQRRDLWDVIVEEVKGNSECGEKELLIGVLHQLELVQSQKRVSGRLIEGYATGLMLPHDALPVRFTDHEAEVLLTLPIADKALRRMLQPGILKQGRR